MNLETLGSAFLTEKCFRSFEADWVEHYSRIDIDENSAGVIDLPVINAWNYDFEKKSAVESTFP